MGSRNSTTSFSDMKLADFSSDNQFQYGEAGLRPPLHTRLVYGHGMPPTNAATDPSAAHKSASRKFIGIVLSDRTYEDLTIPGPESDESI
jgi:hypothetical protein